MLVPADLRYSEDHQWIRIEGDLWRVGLTSYAQEALGDITLVTITAPGEPVAGGSEMGEVEAFKAITDLYMPVTGTIVEHNPELVEHPEVVNDDPYGAGWLCIVRPADVGTAEQLLDAAAYRSLIGADDA